MTTQGASQASDSRATFSSGNATTCAEVGLSGTAQGTGDNPGNGSTDVGPGLFTLTVASYTNADIQSPFQILNGGKAQSDSQMVQITNVAAGVTINGVVVKGGDGYNLYTSVSGVNMISPVNGGGNIPAISHAFVCYSGTPATGSLTVSKTVVGTPPGGSTFTVSVACPASGTPLSGFPKTLTFNSSGTLTSGKLPITGIPAGTQCSVTETGTGGASTTTYTVNGGSPGANPPTVTISSTAQQSVAITNTYTGSLTVSKTVVGTPPEGSTFTVSVACPASGTPLSGFPKTLTFNSSGTLTSGTLPITGIPAGTQCSVTETGTGGASTTTYTVNGGSPGANPPTVTISSTAQQSVAITNTYTPGLGSLTVTKTVVGTPPGGSTFTVSVACPASGTPLSGFPKTLTFNSSGALTGGTLPITGIPAGTQCSVTETGTGGATSTTYAVNGGSSSSNPPTVVISSSTERSVAVTNTYTGSLTVSKNVFGNAPGGATFTVSVACPASGTPLSGFPKTLTFNSSGTLTGGTLPITGIPAGTQCSVTETNAGGATSTLYTVNGGSPGANPPTVTISSTAQQSVAVSNLFPGASTVGSVQVHKVVNGTPPNEVKSFTVNVSCTDGTNVNLVFGTSGGIQTVNGITIPPGGTTTCTVTETDTGRATSVSYGPESNGQFVLTVGSPAHTLVVTNRFDPIAVEGVTVTQAGVLAFTGMDLSTLLQVAAGLLGVGLLLSLATRRRRRLA